MDLTTLDARITNVEHTVGRIAELLPALAVRKDLTRAIETYSQRTGATKVSFMNASTAADRCIRAALTPPHYWQ